MAVLGGNVFTALKSLNIVNSCDHPPTALDTYFSGVARIIARDKNALSK